ncbi:hypothetical protein HYH03_010484 [Edaphochlamys debaryana]|uniref:Uncharacterized protein n=1 Tax=Edaphochlamys debaryana TaxID=47281 RepID=A0A836BWJ3_9CHLO|nr:hypothetical protein HYH03_010484 [Edaphochlamys debaryana]|eukprot:KAG2491037.1 hypothetical protein HYH03_010484 [Edaphochlamys debaryana]
MDGVAASTAAVNGFSSSGTSVTACHRGSNVRGTSGVATTRRGLSQSRMADVQPSPLPFAQPAAQPGVHPASPPLYLPPPHWAMAPHPQQQQQQPPYAYTAQPPPQAPFASSAAPAPPTSACASAFAADTTYPVSGTPFPPPPAAPHQPPAPGYPVNLSNSPLPPPGYLLPSSAAPRLDSQSPPPGYPTASPAPLAPSNCPPPGYPCVTPSPHPHPGCPPAPRTRLTALVKRSVGSLTAVALQRGATQLAKLGARMDRALVKMEQAEGRRQQRKLEKKYHRMG